MPILIFETFTRILLIANLSLNQTLLTFLLCETNLDDSIDSGNFSVRVYLPLIRKDSSTHMHSLAVSVKEGLYFAQDVSLEKLCRFLLMFLTGFTSVSALLLFPLVINFFVLVHSF